MVMYLLLAVAAGFASVWLWGIIHRSYEGWYAVAWRVACYFPGISLLLLSVLNVLIHHTGSSGAIPLGAFFSLVSLWFLVSIPLCFSGMILQCVVIPCESLVEDLLVLVRQELCCSAIIICRKDCQNANFCLFAHDIIVCAQLHCLNRVVVILGDCFWYLGILVEQQYPYAKGHYAGRQPSSVLQTIPCIKVHAS